MLLQSNLTIPVSDIHKMRQEQAIALSISVEQGHYARELSQLRYNLQ